MKSIKSINAGRGNGATGTNAANAAKACKEFFSVNRSTLLISGDVVVMNLIFFY